MYNRPLVPPGFRVPASLDLPNGFLRMLSIDDLELDFEAVMKSAARLKGLLDPDSSWPEGLTKADDLIDLAWHQREFTLRHSFAYTYMARDNSRCLGCAYIFPSNAAEFDATVFYWVREGADAEQRDRDFGAAIRAWLKNAWPFQAVAFPGRDISWPAWRTDGRKV
jgi:hypothetical protein